MKPIALSPAAQAALDELTPDVRSCENWNLEYLDLLNRLAMEKLPDLVDVEVKGQGIDLLRKSREEHAVAVELQAYATAELGDVSDDLTMYPTEIHWNDFLERLIAKSTPSERKKRFNEFLLGWAETRVDEAMDFHSVKMSRSKHLVRLVDERLGSFGKVIPPILQRDLTVEFRAWSKQQNRQQLLARNKEKTAEYLERVEKVLALLPVTTRAHEGITRKEWEFRAIEAKITGSAPTFTRIKNDLVGRYIESKTGKTGKRYRRERITREMIADFP